MRRNLRPFAIVMLAMMCLPFMVHASTTLSVETKYGTEQVVIPDGYTAEDVLVKVAGAYYELNHDFDELTSKTESLTKSVEEYVEENRSLRTKYDDLIKDYDLLVRRLESYNSLGGFIKGFAGVHLTKGMTDTTFGFGVNVGGLVLGRAVVMAGMNYPWGITLSLSYLFD